ncbi:TPA: hypothetical protein ACNRHW_004815, partial [Escherichia coli]
MLLVSFSCIHSRLWILPQIFSRLTKAYIPVHEMLAVMIFLSGLLLMTSKRTARAVLTGMCYS